jgi:hypothetical protein
MEVKSTVSTLAKNVYRFLRWKGMIEKQQQRNALVIGMGWYGCHIAQKLIQQGYNVSMVDKTDKIGTGSSTNNQNRLHLGFHYPRSGCTRRECRQGYQKMIQQYSNMITHIDSYYIISKMSLLDYETFQGIYDHEGYQFQVCHISDIKSMRLKTSMVYETSMLVEEPFLSGDSFITHFEPILSTTRIPFNKYEMEAQQVYSLVVDCTYGQLLQSFHPDKNHEYNSELCIAFVYKIRDTSIAPFAITIMDGPFFSIHPYKINEGLYTVTHVAHSIISSNESDAVNAALHKTLEDVHAYIENFDDMFVYHGYFIGHKAKRVNHGADDRSLIYTENMKLHSFIGGKITGIFEAEAIIDSVIQNKVIST